MDYAVKTLQQLPVLLVGFRKQAGLTQAEIAQRLGISQQAYARIEANPAGTSMERLFTILRLLGAEISIAHSTDHPTHLYSEPQLSTTATALKKTGVAASTKLSASSKKKVNATEHNSTRRPSIAAVVKKGKIPSPPKVLPSSKKKEIW